MSGVFQALGHPGEFWNTFDRAVTDRSIVQSAEVINGDRLIDLSPFTWLEQDAVEASKE